ncbi:uncharacterized protein L3040_009085 [Drepanopeziza brunnea f. sp. 'multigermtubi']|uniref:uncharacterized protein n=1 Tax=Drepanopeziza brunnea f. sp. 'multigermtubi' TaxID=698441 RepID=UPI00239B4D28|nr:hypothetical protein L3040_009085 [Drepanopeziza brunnea f. sp. 'multigermtubi']
MAEEDGDGSGSHPNRQQINGALNNERNGGGTHDPEKQEHKHDYAHAKDKVSKEQQKLKDKANPPGGYDATPIPSAPDGYTIKFTFHRATNLPVSDLHTRSSDPFIHATLTSGLAKRHKEDPDLSIRTPTIHRNTDPKWDTQWIVAGVPSSGFRLKCRLYDEDPSDHDDRLGNVTVHVDRVGPDWQGIKDERFYIEKRMGSKRAYLLRGCAAMLSNVHVSGNLWLSAELVGESEKPHGRMYTVGLTSWVKHYSPMIGRIAGTKAPGSSEGSQEGGPKTEKYDFQANEFQLEGPVPADLYHRFVEFKPFVKGMFSKAGLRGRVLNRALRHQHASVYNFSSTTEYGTVEPKSEEAALQFLKMVHYDEGGRIFTYVLTLDGLLRFTETGKEFGIDLLSKHTMHSDVNTYIAYSGEFFVRRLKKPEISAEAPDQETHPAHDLPGGPPDSPPPQSPRNYELVIDNDSGTYRPKGSLLPQLKAFLREQFPGLHIVTKECTDDKLMKMKEGQRERKKKEGKTITMVQHSDDDISSSDEEALDNHSKKTTKQRAFDALEDPGKAAKDIIHGVKGKREKEERETLEDRAEAGGAS